MAARSEGVAAVRLARQALETCIDWDGERDPAFVAEEEELPASFEEKRGLFVTLLDHPTSDLRGCIGFTDPIFRLREGIPRAALYAAKEDPRFPPLVRSELARIRVEVSLLTRPTPLVPRRPMDLLQLVQVGRDGLTVAEGEMKGVLLPQVPVDEGWDVETFLSQTCRKAGLPLAAWRRPGPRFWSFRSTIFAEETPRGPIVEHTLAPPPQGGSPPGGEVSPSRA